MTGRLRSPRATVRRGRHDDGPVVCRSDGGGVVTAKPRLTREEATVDALRALTGLLHLLTIIGFVAALLGVVPFLNWALGG